MWFTSLSHDVTFMWLWALYLVELVDVIIQILCYSYALLLYLMTHKYRGSQPSSREVKPKFIDSTQGEPKNICKP
jgi:hypothetical protein